MAALHAGRDGINDNIMSVSAKATPITGSDTRRVVIVVYPGVTLLDAAGPSQVFSSANEVPGSPGEAPRYRVVLASPDGGEIRTDTGITLGTLPLRQASARPIDTLIVAGGFGVFDVLEEKTLTRWIASRHKACRRVATTCMGAFLAAEAGLLTGQTVTTHWRRVEELQARYPDIRVQCDPLFTRSIISPVIIEHLIDIIPERLNLLRPQHTLKQGVTQLFKLKTFRGAVIRFPG